MITKSVTIPDVDEFDVEVKLPAGRMITLQYRNYEDPCVDIILDRQHIVYNFANESMDPAKAAGGAHIRKADQLCIPLND